MADEMKPAELNDEALDQVAGGRKGAEKESIPDDPTTYEECEYYMRSSCDHTSGGSYCWTGCPFH